MPLTDPTLPIVLLVCIKDTDVPTSPAAKAHTTRTIEMRSLVFSKDTYQFMFESSGT
jgi:hypothetical protein